VDCAVTRLPVWHFEHDASRTLLTQHFGTKDLAGFGAEDLPVAVAAAGALLGYARKTQGQNLDHVVALLPERSDAYVRLDPATRRNLELTETLRGQPAPTLCSLLDRCVTGMGSRLLRHWLHHPLRDRGVLQERLDAVAELGGDTTADLHTGVHALFRQVADVERIAGRIALKSARPRDLSSLRETLAALPEVATTLGDVASPKLQVLRDALQAPPAIRERLQQAIAEEPSVLLREGG